MIIISLQLTTFTSYKQVLKPEAVQSVRTVMYGCGMHNHSGQFAFDVSCIDKDLSYFLFRIKVAIMLYFLQILGFSSFTQLQNIHVQVGLPSKSGISGCMLVIVPNVMGICLWSPPLDEVGNSVRGSEFCKELVKRYSFHRYENNSQPRSCTVFLQIKEIEPSLGDFKGV